MDGFERKAASSGRKVVDLAVQVFGRKPQIEGLRGIGDLWQYVEICRNAREMPVQVSCESRMSMTSDPHQDGAVTLNIFIYVFGD